MRASTYAVIGVMITATLLLISLTVIGRDSEGRSVGTLIEPTQITVVSILPTPLPLPSNYHYVELYEGEGEFTFELSASELVIPIDPYQLFDWCNNCWSLVAGTETGHVVAYTQESQCSTVMIQRTAKAADSNKELLVHAQLITTHGEIEGSGAAEINGVCIAVFWLSDNPIG